MKILLTETQKKELLSFDELSYIMVDYYNGGELEIDIKIFKDKFQLKIFKDLTMIVNDLIEYGIRSDDFMNTDNLGFNSKGDMCFFDIGFGNHSEDFEDHPHEIDLNELDLGIGEEITNKILSKYTTGKSIKLGEGGYFGVAYDIGDGKVLKITKDKTEAINSKKLIGKTPKHLAKIYEVKFIKRGEDIFYVILLEKLLTTNKIYKTFVAIEKTISENQNNNFRPNIIDMIKKNNPFVAEFLISLYKHGRQLTWEKYLKQIQDQSQYDFNDIEEIAEWIFGSSTNNNDSKDGVPDHIMQLVRTLL